MPKPDQGAFKSPFRNDVIELIALLRKMADQYADLRTHALRRGDCIRRGDATGMKELLEIERNALAHVDSLDRQRALTSSRLAQQLGLSLDASLDAIGPHIADLELQDDLENVRRELRNRIKAFQKEMDILKYVSDSLLTHVNGLVQRLHLMVSQAAVYGRDGRVGGRRPVMSGVDLRT